MMQVAEPAFSDELGGLIRDSSGQKNGLLACGLRRSYGDSCINDNGRLIQATRLDRFISFDRSTGVIEAEAGVSLKDVIDVAIPAGFMLPVTPGTKFVTLGGAVANDVHGKNHHVAGTFGRFVRQIVLLRSDGTERAVTRDDDTGLFAATIGGLGLTGIITRVTLQLQPVTSSDLNVETFRFGNLAEFFKLVPESEASHEYMVAWVDCLATGSNLGRGIFTRARHATTGDLTVHAKKGPSIPVDTPGFALNRLSLSVFNELYFRIAGRPRRATVSYDSFFYPLDAIGGWNKLYGCHGFFQYQSVLPPGTAEAATAQMLRTIGKAGQGSPLVVLKTFGDLPSPGFLSFPMQGTTLALDFTNLGPSTLNLFNQLDTIVNEAGGRLYPAKDGRFSTAMFKAGFPALDRFRTHIDPGMSSTFWRRMNL